MAYKRVDAPVRADGHAQLLRPRPAWFRTASSQTLLLGWIFFCVPGMWNAITSMAGGLDDARVAPAAPAGLYLAYRVASLIAPSVNSVIGPRVPLAVGALGLAFDVASLLR